jgi:hypothetical protein
MHLYQVTVGNNDMYDCLHVENKPEPRSTAFNPVPSTLP